MHVYVNRACGNGGALYADSGGLFDVYGQVNLEANRADSGGAVYLANASRLWLDDCVQIGPELWGNHADYGSGGAVHASNIPRVECDGATLGRTGDGNQAAVDGGALAAYTSTLSLRATYVSAVSAASGEPDPRDGLAPLAPAATGCGPALGLCML